MAHVVPVRKELGGAHDLQLPRPADQPGRRDAASCSASPTAATRRRSPRPWSASAASGRWSSPPTTASTSSAIAGRHARDRGRRRRHRGVVRRARGARARSRRRSRRSPAATPEENAAVVARGARRARRARARDVVAAQRRRRDLRRPAAPRDLARGRRAGPREAIDSGAARDVLERLVAPHPRARRRELGSSLVDDGHDRRARRGRAGRRGAATRAGPARGPRARGSATRAEQRPFSEALVRPGLSLIAEFKRRSPSAGEIRAGADAGRDRRAPTSAAAPPRSRCSPTSAHFGGSLDDLRAARAACEPADPAQGLHRRPLPALRGGGRTAPTRCC